jgi:hypothetical protein
MSDELLAALIGGISGALIGTITTVLGWFVTARQTAETHRQELALQHLQRQIEEFYGPLHGLNQQTRNIYDIVSKRLPSGTDGHIDFNRFSDTDSKIWHHFVETYFLPLNQKMRDIINTKIYLLQGEYMPQSFELFLQHEAQFESLHRLWKEKGIDTSSIPAAGWPKDFSGDVEKSLIGLRAQYKRYIRDLTRL